MLVCSAQKEGKHERGYSEHEGEKVRGEVVDGATWRKSFIAS
jgi:hypothetical protein